MKHYTCDRCKEKTSVEGLELPLLVSSWCIFELKQKDRLGNDWKKPKDLCKKCVIELLEAGLAKAKGVVGKGGDDA